MPPRQQTFARGEFFHLYNRGVNRERVFFSRDNYLHFLRKLRQYFFDENRVIRARFGKPDAAPDSESKERVDDRPVQVVCYCLMPNHYHLLVRLNCDDLPARMQSLSQAYTNAINRAHSRVGPLFQGRFKARQIQHEEVLMHLSRYIHRNPVTAGLVAHPNEWEFPSYPDFLRLRNLAGRSQDVRPIPEAQAVLVAFSSVGQYQSFVENAGPELPSRLQHLALDE